MVSVRDVRRWERELRLAASCVEARFSRKELKAHLREYLLGLISRAERKNDWQLAEELGHTTPTNFQHFIARSRLCLPRAAHCNRKGMPTKFATISGRMSVIIWQPTRGS